MYSDYNLQLKTSEGLCGNVLMFPHFFVSFWVFLFFLNTLVWPTKNASFLDNKYSNALWYQ